MAPVTAPAELAPSGVPSTLLAPSGIFPSTLLGLCNEMLDVQRERALSFSAFNDGFKFYLENGAEGPYRNLLKGLTHQFQMLSRRALAVETALRDADNSLLYRPDIADVVRTIQNAEKKKLELTLAMQSLKSAMHQERFSWQHGDGGIGGEHTCSSHGGHAHGTCTDHAAHADAAHAELPVEPTEAEIKGALKESTTEMEACIAAINDGIAELREISTDLESV
jgi:hypothetical protein